MIKTTVEDVMSKPVVTIERDASLREIARRMHQYQVASLLICDESKILHGVLTSSDVLAALAAGSDPDETRAESIASTDIITIEPDQDIREAVALMKSHGIRHLPVVTNESLVGIVSVTDLSPYSSRGRLPRKPKGASDYKE